MTTNTEPRIAGTMTVNEAIRLFPATVAVFEAYGIDACCGGAAPIATAAARHGAELGPLLDALDRAASEG